MSTDQASVQTSTFKLSDFTAPEPKAETPEAPATGEDPGEQEAEDALDAEAGSEAEEEAQPEGDAEPEAEEQPRRKSKSIQERFDEVTAARREAEREADYWRGVAEGRIKPEPAKPDQAPAKRDLNPGPDPADFEYGEADPKFIAAVARHEAKLEFEAQREHDRIESEMAQLEKGWTDRKAEAIEKYPDFEEKVTRTAARGEWPCPPVIALGIKQSEVGHHVAYHLASNLDEAIRIAELPDILQAREFGRLEARFMAQQEAGPEPEKKLSTAPPPPQTRARGSGGQFEPSERGLYRKMLKEFR